MKMYKINEVNECVDNEVKTRLEAHVLCESIKGRARKAPCIAIKDDKVVAVADGYMEMACLVGCSHTLVRMCCRGSYNRDTHLVSKGAAEGLSFYLTSETHHTLYSRDADGHHKIGVVMPDDTIHWWREEE